tara:strand:+ start:175 stop:1059 length:885 start_codon:yes stop_codon:yes gene_type:complete
MKKIICFIFLYIISFQTYSYAAQATGNAEVLKVTMRKIELCAGYQGGDFDDILTDAFCNNPVVIGSGDKVVDIAGVNAGAAAASYGDPALLPLGETYTHMRVTIDRAFTIQSGTIDTGGTNKTDQCMTKAIDDSFYPNDESTDKYTHRPIVAEGGNSGTAEEMNTYFINGAPSSTHDNSGTYTQCFNEECSQINNNWYQTYLDTETGLVNNGDSNIAQSIHQASNATDDFILIYKLTNPYTVSMTPPTIDIAFGTQGAIGAQEVCNSGGSNCTGQTDGMCSFYIADVKVQITIR